MRIVHSKKVGLALALVLFLSAVSITRLAMSEADPVREKANDLYMRLTNGVPLLSDNILFNDIMYRVGSNDLMSAAQIITHPTQGAREFYDNMVASIPQHWNRDDNAVGERNELSAMFVGTVRDAKVFKSILDADRVYYDPTITDGNSYVANNNRHFQTVWESRSAREALKEDRRPGFQGVGIFTARPWFENYIDMGTNRRPIYGILHHLYCTKIQDIQTLLIPDMYVKKDVPRAPGGDVTTYLNNCRSCHSFMDALIPRAFARFDFLNNNPVYVPPKDKLNETNYSTEAITNDTWHLFLTAEQNAIFGFNGTSGYGGTNLQYYEGTGLEEFAQMIGDSDGFYKCMATQLATRLYLKKQFSVVTMSPEDKSALASQVDMINNAAMTLKVHQDLRRTIEEMAVYFTEHAR